MEPVAKTGGDFGKRRSEGKVIEARDPAAADQAAWGLKLAR